LPAICAELGAAAHEAAYRVRGAPVYEVRVPCRALPGASVLVVLWFALRRVDVRLLDASGRSVVALTRKDVEAVEIYAGVEVTFRRDGGGFVFVTRDGTVGASD
jgi:hypothetical protein